MYVCTPEVMGASREGKWPALKSCKGYFKVFFSRPRRAVRVAAQVPWAGSCPWLPVVIAEARL